MQSLLTDCFQIFVTKLKYADLVLSSTDYSNEKVKLTFKNWLRELEPKIANETYGWYDETQTEKSLKAIKYKYYNGNTEWDFFAYKIETAELEDVVGKKQYSTINIKFGFQRNSPYYTMTLIIPILVLTLLAPIGLILPGKLSI